MGHGEPPPMTGLPAQLRWCRPARRRQPEPKHITTAELSTDTCDRLNGSIRETGASSTSPGGSGVPLHSCVSLPFGFWGDEEGRVPVAGAPPRCPVAESRTHQPTRFNDATFVEPATETCKQFFRSTRGIVEPDLAGDANNFGHAHEQSRCSNSGPLLRQRTKTSVLFFGHEYDYRSYGRHDRRNAQFPRSFRAVVPSMRSVSFTPFAAVTSSANFFTTVGTVSRYMMRVSCR